MFTNREIATGIWFLLLALFALTHAPVRQSVIRLFTMVLTPKLLISLLLALTYVVAVVDILWWVGLWTPMLLQDTVMWFGLTAIASLMKFVTARKPKNIFRSIVRDSIAVMVIIEFVANSYTLPIVGEMILVPFMALVAMTAIIAERDESHKQVSRLLNGVLVFTGLSVLSFSTFKAIADYEAISRIDTWRSLVNAPLLSLLFAPFIFMTVICAQYEMVFLRLSFGPEKCRRLLRHAKMRILCEFGLNPYRLNDFASRNASLLMQLQSKGDIDAMLSRERINRLLEE